MPSVSLGPTMKMGELEQVEFAVVGGGVTGPTCVVIIETALKDLPGMDDVKANLGSERITALVPIPVRFHTLISAERGD